MEREVKMRIVLEKATAGCDFGVQEGRGTYKTALTKRGAGKDLVFEFTMPVKGDKTPVFGGPIAQGPPATRYMYLDIGAYAGQKETPWSRRLKIPLTGITWKMIDAGNVLVARIPGTGTNDEPNCAYVWRKQVGPKWNWEPALHVLF